MPLLAVARELKLAHPEITIIAVTDKGGRFTMLLRNSTSIDHVYEISAGKFRRHHDETIMQRLLDARTNLLNIRDFFKFLYGTIESCWLMVRVRPWLMFSKGGYVVVPVGLAAALWRTPIITHDSDTLPGLSNIILARWAQLHTTGMPKKYYDYPADATKFVGIPIASNYKRVDTDTKRQARKLLKLPANATIVLVTGGSQGSRRLNKSIIASAANLLVKHQNLYIIHQVGAGNTADYRNFNHPRLQIHEFISGMHDYSAAADIVITQASATTIVELGVQQKAVISLPSPHLAGGHQLKNARFLQEANAAIVIKPASEAAMAKELVRALDELILDSHKRRQLSLRLHSSIKQDAAKELAAIIYSSARNENKEE